MRSIELSDKEMTYLLLALRKYEEVLSNVSDDEVGDSIGDLLIVQALRKKIKSVKDQTE